MRLRGEVTNSGFGKASRIGEYCLVEGVKPGHVMRDEANAAANLMIHDSHLSREHVSSNAPQVRGQQKLHASRIRRRTRTTSRC